MALSASILVGLATVVTKMLKELCHGSPVHFVLFCEIYYLPSLTMELKVGKEITCK